MEGYSLINLSSEIANTESKDEYIGIRDDNEEDQGSAHPDDVYGADAEQYGE